MRWRFGITLVTLFAVVPLALGQATTPKTSLSLADLHRLERVRATALAPDGQSLVTERQWTDATRTERHALWLTRAGEKPRLLEAGEPDGRAPVFSPNGRWVAFLSTRPRPAGARPTPPAAPEVEPATEIWLIRPEGGAALPLAGPDKPYGRVFNDGFYGRVAFSPDGKKIAFVADDGRDPRGPDEVAAGVELVRPDQGEGYTGYGTAQLWVAELDDAPTTHAARRIDRLTHDDIWYGDPQWSPDGRTIVVHANKTADRESVRYSINKNYDLWAIDVAAGKQRQLTDGPGPEVSPRFAPDGKTLACLSIPRKGSHMDVFSLALVSMNGDKPAWRVLHNQHAPHEGPRPHPAPAFPLPEDCWDDANHLGYSAPDGTQTRTVRVDVRSGRVAEGAGTTTARAKQRAALALPVNAFLKERRLAEGRVVTWENEGLKLEGILTLPPSEGAKAPYPLIVFPHGGPHSRSTQGFDMTVQLFAAHGYAVFQPNFRGSAGYGQAFIDADRGDFGGGDMRDILTGIDRLIAQKTIDPERQFVYGISYGGYMTTWLVGHTDRFRAAVAQNAVTDLNVMWGLSDLQSWTEWEFGGRPWEVPEKMRRHSPITYVDRVKTPTLILHSREDRRCPIAMGRMYHQALRARGVPTEMIVYPDEGHGIRQPRHQEDVLRRTLAWFAKYDRR